MKNRYLINILATISILTVLTGCSTSVKANVVSNKETKMEAGRTVSGNSYTINEMSELVNLCKEESEYAGKNMPDSFNASHPRTATRQYLLGRYGSDTTYNFIISEVISPTNVNVKCYLKERKQFRNIRLELQEDKTFLVLNDELDHSHE
jgi:hypothetical protein